ncbi:hypothetical protein VNI00_003036 [Paramarasmius palmivorus]|uniref:Alpha/beta hydrolase fold-3 domain-containing protein n=1 Tax=Paramarasmius palmivorus TaxID=297713 RepID=A0AAW0DXG1_9AGAR
MTTPTIWERITVLPKLLPLPFILGYNAFVSLFSSRDKPIARILNERSVRYTTSVLTIPQLQWISPSTTETYRQWTRKHKLPELIEYTPEGVAIMWIGPKDAKDILFVAHGGGFMLPLTDFMLTFWSYVRRQLERQGHAISVVFFEYSIYPNPFPVPLTQACHALSFILETHSNAGIHLAGDSAGGNLILQLFSHTLRPLLEPEVPVSPLTAAESRPRIKNVILISPWTSPGIPLPPRPNERDVDIFTRRIMVEWGNIYIQNTSPTYLPYMRFTDGFGDIARYIPQARVYVFVGAREHLRDDGLGVYEALKGELGKDKVLLELQRDGVHDDPMVHIAAGAQELNEVGNKMVDWLAVGL